VCTSTSPTSTPTTGRSKAAGAEIVVDLQDMAYGSREYAARDLDGHLWSFGTYRPARNR
jgi:uncharacterized glyoxalase superfamily protein PhnB